VETNDVEMIEIDQENEDLCLHANDDYNSKVSALGGKLLCENECEDEAEPCLYQLFYEKLIKYFGDIVYTLEACEARQQNAMDDSPSIISSVSNTVNKFYFYFWHVVA